MAGSERVPYWGPGINLTDFLYGIRVINSNMCVLSKLLIKYFISLAIWVLKTMVILKILIGCKNI